MKELVWMGSSYRDLREFPEDAMQDAGYQLHRLQSGKLPMDWKPMAGIGQGVHEVRIHEESGAFRVIYVAKFTDAVYVLHAFQKKTQKTAQHDINLARERFKAMTKERTA
ncbi:type II toxin-antitoxin system RelE/ParE family toxin [Candidatus Thiothrix anitrata]|jgi:phage-related protein|uniref:Type II toxin-antitoxin system RelE/ParE family toxin n=1 Tax=Candidatus Thiothrix anitrata TaxID=2823902 RepID=A0ABX7X0S7_9GAMM|nr:type II toxin-antitoxin system RelE/ParE family toxin [Candidatus Thiothrix anitrata]QTR49519.1 type II toxin-antitoxin system RelE/ParE family toxin [Candidatus Thiothrix anitrata]